MQFVNAFMLLHYALQSVESSKCVISTQTLYIWSQELHAKLDHH